MPVLHAAGLDFQVASDIVPLLAGCSLVLEIIWCITVGCLFSASTPGACVGLPDTGAYVGVLFSTFALFFGGLFLDAALIAVGLRGASAPAPPPVPMSDLMLRLFASLRICQVHSLPSRTQGLQNISLIMTAFLKNSCT